MPTFKSSNYTKMSVGKHVVLAILSIFLYSNNFAQNTPSASSVLKEATEKAKKGNKQVFLIFHASWCVWCHRMDSLITKTSLDKTFNKHFVLTHITILENKPERKKEENAGGMDVFTQYGGGANTGIPYWVVLGNDGKYLANSRLKSAEEDPTGNNGDNTGCPSETQEVAYFTTVLKKVANFSTREIDEVNAVFEKK